MRIENSFVTALLALALALPAVAQKTHAYYQAHPIRGLAVPEKALSFLVVGDWGHNGHFEQRRVADRMDEAAYRLVPAFFVSTGDNFYEDGVASVEDPLWRSCFEEVYEGPLLFKPWYAVLGNHDYVGSAQAQVDYTRRSQRWQMPARYHAFERELQDGSGERALFVFLDTSPFQRPYHASEEYGKVAGQDTTAQREWLEETLASSGARWKVVVGHHPLYSAGLPEGEAGGLRGTLGPIFEQHRVDAYFAGHEHQLQHVKPSGAHTHFFVSGAGAVAEPLGGGASKARFAEATAGFMSVSLQGDRMLVQVISAQGEVIHRAEVTKRSR